MYLWYEVSKSFTPKASLARMNIAMKINKKIMNILVNKWRLPSLVLFNLDDIIKPENKLNKKFSWSIIY